MEQPNIKKNPPIGLVIFDFDNTLLKGDSNEYEFDFNKKVAVNINDGKIINFDELINKEIIKTLTNFKKQGFVLSILSATEQKLLTTLVNALFGTEIFDMIASVETCYNLLPEKDKNKYEIRKFLESYHLYEKNPKRRTKNICLQGLMHGFGTNPVNTIYFDDNHELITSANDILYFNIQCENPLNEYELKETFKYYNRLMKNIFTGVDTKFDQEINKLYNDCTFLFNSIEKNRLMVNNEYNGLLEKFKEKCCDLKYISKLMDSIYFKTNGKIKFPLNQILSKDNIIMTFSYFKYIEMFYNQEDSIVYSLGDSLDKLNFIWNLYNDKKIINIPFSGSMYENIEKSEKIKLLTESELLMYGESDNLIKNNKKFSEMLQHIKSGKKILITDFGHSGKAYLTIINLLNKMGVKNYKDVFYLHITPSIDEIENNILLNNISVNINRIYIDELPHFYYTNSDRIENGFTRCVPRYSVDLWNGPPDDVWKNEFEKNYYLCNLHRCLLLIALCCVNKNYIENKYSFVLKGETKEKYTEIKTNNSIEINTFINSISDIIGGKRFEKRYKLIK
ncbi:HAD-like protein [Fadolivirus algeromassiliense]|jgi:hypothetical protein|uniref:HAD-like protein n=1 Tax=Fadolivirus FV1/VV64 TaxID=3070911 RepID=A0A7D3QVB5_9VIRU|nr:HAD-like protein [Fadolivirus algeromassiliense]QKF94763.1 HAD-like protein [Fadolivirus FV1/VV64]